MYRIGKTYKFEIKEKIFYTGIVLEEDTVQLRIKTIRDEELILNKGEIRQSKLIEQDNIGGLDGRG